MNRQQLLQYFQEHYLSRQEVLFKLPLNVPVDSFWHELQNWRKNNATILPLCNAVGKPYWFVTTNKMIAASEILSEEARSRDGSFDPFRIEQTAAITQEAYFTSYVEGADYPLDEAVAFLRRGTEPENMYEQNILNNHQAWSYMLGTFTSPMNETFVKDLAFYLTEGQNDGTIDYRQTDNAEIPAMGSESFEVPSAFSLPKHMNAFYGFLDDSNIHPLIRASAAHGWVFANRPFPDGNERLARLLSSAVLLRCGYDFFLDISLSANISHDSFHYFKAIKEIIRKENDGDMTYFMEYYLQMLANALTGYKKSQHEQSLEIERQMAMQPLAPSPPRHSDTDSQVPAHAQVTTGDQTALHGQAATDSTNVASTEAGDSSNNTVRSSTRQPETTAIDTAHTGGNHDNITNGGAPICPATATVDAFAFQSDSGMASVGINLKNINFDVLIPRMKAMLDVNTLTFPAIQYAEVNDITCMQAVSDCRRLYNIGLTDRYMRHGHYEFTFRFSSEAEMDLMVARLKHKISTTQADSSKMKGNTASYNSGSPDMNFWDTLAELECSDKDSLRHGAAFIQGLIRNGKHDFTLSQLSQETRLSIRATSKLRNKLHDLGLIYRLGPIPFQTYRLSFVKEQIPKDTDILPQDVSDLFPSDTIEGTPSQSLIDYFDRLRMSDSHIDQRTGQFYLDRIQHGNKPFTVEEYQLFTGCSESVARNDIQSGRASGLLQMKRIPGTMLVYYKVISTIDVSESYHGLSQKLRDRLSSIYSVFRDNPFTTLDYSKINRLSHSTTNHNLNALASRGIIIPKKSFQKYTEYSWAVTPETHPECFNFDIINSVAKERNIQLAM